MRELEAQRAYRKALDLEYSSRPQSAQGGPRATYAPPEWGSATHPHSRAPCAVLRCARRTAPGSVLCRAGVERANAPPAGLTPPTSAAGLGSPLPHLHRDWARPLPHLRPDWARPAHYSRGTCARKGRGPPPDPGRHGIPYGTGPPASHGCCAWSGSVGCGSAATQTATRSPSAMRTSCTLRSASARPP